jgi:hypothetical protein
MHREVIINYGKIDEDIKRLDSYLTSLYRIERAVDANSRLLSDQKGEAFEMLETRRRELKELIGVQRGQAKDLKKSLSAFSGDMESLIHPRIRSRDVRVRREDIGYNLMQIKTRMNMTFQRYSLSQLTDQYLYWVPKKKGGYYASDTVKISAEQRNGAKVDGFQSRLFQIQGQIAVHIDNLERIHKTHVQAFENMDDTHAGRAKALYSKYTSGKEGRADIKNQVKKTLKDFRRGAWDAVKGIVIGIGNLAKVGVACVVVGVTIKSANTPDWASKSVDDFKAGFSGLRGPLDFFERMGQDWCDTYEKEGLAYVCGSTTVDIATVVVPAGVVMKGLKPILTSLKFSKQLSVSGKALTKSLKIPVASAKQAKAINKLAKMLDDTPKANLTKADVDFIVNIKPDRLKGISRPNPEDYLDLEYINAHKALFEDGVSRIQKYSPEDWRGGTVGAIDGTSFVSPKAYIDAVIETSNGDNRILEKILGLKKGYFGDTSPVRIDITPANVNNLHIPSGNETGAINDFWRPGGRTYPGGLPEAVIDEIPKGDYTWSYLN